MKLSTYALFLVIFAITYFGTSKLIFDRVYDTSQLVIDELFHLRQGLAFCQRNFSYWDPKITTLPGLYFVSTAVLGSYFECTVYNLRYVNLIASCINLLLFSSILRYIYSMEQPLKVVLQAFNLAILPPLYFFSHLYYTDTLSLTFLLAFSRLCLGNKHNLLIQMLGMGGIFMRQTNVIWIAMVFGHKLLDLLIRSSRVFGNKYIGTVSLSKHSSIAKDTDKSKLKRYYDLTDVYTALKYHLSTCFTTIFKFLTYQDATILVSHIIILVSFATFVFINGSIVIGDKKAHEATLHVPQMLYFLLFYGVFGLPYVLAKLPSTLKLIFNNKIKAITLVLVFLAAVHYNTIVHPYLLADNRHYTFYIWSRWLSKYEFAKYATVPAYVFLLFSLYDNLKDQNCVSFLLPFTICAFLALALQRLVEIRYFLVPYVILRLRFVRPSYKVVLFETVWYLALNAATFYLFFTKEIIWKDFKDSQRLIW